VTPRGRAVLFLLVFGSGATSPSHVFSGNAGPVLYVDAQITGDTRTYDPVTRRAAGGTAHAVPSLRGAARAATPGTTVLVRGGRYDEPLVPRSSGAPGQPILFKGFSGEKAVISGEGLDPAIDLSGRSHIVIEELQVTNVVAWVRAKNAHHNAIRNSSFTRALAHDSRAGINLIDATHNRIEGNLIQGGNDNLSLIHSDRNVVVGNTFRRARHNLWAILCGSFNVIRNNSFHNEQQKIGQITDCEGSPPESPRLQDSTRRNLVEGNTFAFTPSSGAQEHYAGIQYAAQDGIVRRNAFFDTVGPALDLTVYPDEALYVTGNRIFHNVFHGTGFAGVVVSHGSARAFAGNVFTNNVLSGSVFQRNDGRWRWYAVLAGKPVQIMLGRRDGVLFERNLIYGGSTGAKYTVSFGRRDSEFNPGGRPLSEWQEREKKVFVSNLEADPLFLDAPGHDFQPGPGSPLVDQGAFLTSARSAGTGTTLPVQDARYFFDGFGIAGETGDTVRLEAGESAHVKRVDYVRNELELDRSLTWTAGQGVSLDYTGRAPDIGAFETRP
jgi:parallel beta-helix repeat protein